ncbi:MAG: hypothetical protein PVH00_11970 [Gemmatimonadota bacterium]|jgi:hypothetical protein
MTTGTGGRLRILGGAVLGLVLVVGGLGGAAIDRAVLRDRRPERDECERFRPPQRHRPYEDLGLTEDQKSRIDEALEKRKDQLDEFWKANSPRMDSIVNATRGELRDILTPEQRAEADRRNDRRRAERRALEERCRQQMQQNDGDERQSMRGQQEGLRRERPRVEDYRA